MKFSIRDLMWLTVVVALVCGLFAQRHQLAISRGDAEYKLKVEHDEELKKMVKEHQGNDAINMQTLSQFYLGKAKAREVEFRKELDEARAGR